MGIPLDGADVFGNDHPLELEIGSGKGSFLVDEAQRRPAVNFLGVERAMRYWRYACDRLHRSGCTNVRLALAEAGTFVRDVIADESLSAAHIYFPDPWPKTRHQKRRLIQPAFVELLARKLKPGARLQVVTDHKDYFEQIVAVLTDSSLEPTSFVPLTSKPEAEELVGSNFERKYRNQGRPIYSIAAIKKPHS